MKTIKINDLEQLGSAIVAKEMHAAAERINARAEYIGHDFGLEGDPIISATFKPHIIPPHVLVKMHNDRDARRLDKNPAELEKLAREIKDNARK